MYKKIVKILPSSIEGKGVFADEDISNGDIVWIFEKGYDLLLSDDDFNELTSEKKKELEKVSYLSPWSGKRVVPPENDPARFTNHSRRNNLSVVYDEDISNEPYFIASRDIKSGEELTNNYLEFDLLAQDIKPEWI